MPRPSRSKYRAVKTILGGVRFDSKKEARRWGELQLMEKAGRISLLQRQVNIPLHVGGIKVATYRADFTYRENDQLVVEDAKGYQTDIFKLKWKIVKILYPEWRFVLS